jgi:ribosomal protein S19E (S16A)
MRKVEQRLTRRRRVLEAEFPHLVRITPTVQAVFRVVRDELNAEQFTLKEVDDYFAGDHGNDDASETRAFQRQFFDVDRRHIRTAMSKLNQAGLIEKKKDTWRVTEAGRHFDDTPAEEIPTEELEYDDTNFRPPVDLNFGEE